MPACSAIIINLSLIIKIIDVISKFKMKKAELFKGSALI